MLCVRPEFIRLAARNGAGAQPLPGPGGNPGLRRRGLRGGDPDRRHRLLTTTVEPTADLAEGDEIDISFDPDHCFLLLGLGNRHGRRNLPLTPALIAHRRLSDRLPRGHAGHRQLLPGVRHLRPLHRGEVRRSLHRPGAGRHPRQHGNLHPRLGAGGHRPGPLSGLHEHPHQHPLQVPVRHHLHHPHDDSRTSSSRPAGCCCSTRATASSTAG